MLTHLDIEKSALSKIISDFEGFKQYQDLFKPERFSDSFLFEVAKAIQILHNQSKEVNLVTVNEYLRKNHANFSQNQINELLFFKHFGNTLQTELLIIHELWMKRELVKFYEQQISDIISDADVFNTIDVNTKKIDNLLGSISGNASWLPQELHDRFIEQQEKIQTQGSSGILSNIASIDEIYRGFKNSDFIIWAARPSMGKTGLLLSVARKIALNGIYVGIFSLEMSALQLYLRLVSIENQISVEQINEGLNQYHLNQVKESMLPILKANIEIDDTAALTIRQLRAKATKMKANGCQIIFIDYIQLMQGNKEGNREQEISTISRGIKQTAKELDIPIIALSQLSRKVEERGGDKIPMLSDLRESGTLEQDADVVSFIYRPEYYGIESDSSGSSTHGKALLLTQKHRNGRLGNSLMEFIAQYTEFK